MRVILVKKVQQHISGGRLSFLLITLFFILQGLPCNAMPHHVPCLHNSYVFGMSTVLSGPAAHLGKNMHNGVLAAFKEINLQGGINGRSLCHPAG